MPDLTLQLLASGGAGLKEHFSMFECSIRRHEQKQKCQYDQRIREIEHSTFTCLVFSTTGGMGKAATIFYIRLAAMLSKKREIPYSQMMVWIHCRLSFSLLRVSI